MRADPWHVSCSRATGKGLAFPMQDGQRVIVLGRVSVYERSGSIQLYAREIIKDGVASFTRLTRS